MLPYSEIFNKNFFPTLCHSDLAYFDNAASTQTHMWVLNSMQKYYCEYRSNTRRSGYYISDKATTAVENARFSVANMLNAKPHQIAFNSGATQGLSWVANWCKNYPVAIITNVEHNSNIVPWLSQARTVAGGELVILNAHDDLNSINKIFEKHAGRAVLSITAASNVTGMCVPYKYMSDMAQQRGIPVCLDANQIISYEHLDMQLLSGITWAVFSAHKMYGPTGVGVIYSRDGFDHLDPPYWGGINVQHLDLNSGFVSSLGPHRMEPGTQNIAGIIGTGTAAELIQYATHEHIQSVQANLSHHLTLGGIKELADLDPIGEGFGIGHKTISFRSIKYNPSDIAELLSQQNIAVRAGRLCAHDHVHSLSDMGVLRVSLAPYNTVDDCVRLILGLRKALTILS
jgi:cysteine desulfurase/selenocysteine lyase